MKKVYVLLNETFEEVEALTIVDYLRRAEIEVKTVSMHDELYVKSSHDVVVKADMLFKDLNKEEIDILFIPGGLPASRILSENEEVKELIRYLDKNKKTISAMCAGPLSLETAGIIKDKEITSFPSVKDQLNPKAYLEDAVVISDNVITSRSAATAGFLAMTLIEKIAGEEKRKTNY